VLRDRRSRPSEPLARVGRQCGLLFGVEGRTQSRGVLLKRLELFAVRLGGHALLREQRARGFAQRGTLRQLLNAYVGHLEKQGRQSARDVRSIFNVHVFEAAPEVAMRKATEVKIDDFVRLIGNLTKAGKGRTAAKLRSYLRAAYSLANSFREPDEG
jgi:hypothetical protein